MCDCLGFAWLELQFCGGETTTHSSSRRGQGIFHNDGARTSVAVAHLRIDKHLGALVADVGIMYKDASASYLVFFEGIGNGYLVFGNEPHVTIDATMIGEVELRLFLAWGVGLVVAVVGFDGDD